MKKVFLVLPFLIFCFAKSEAYIQINEFSNDSNHAFVNCQVDGTAAVISTKSLLIKKNALFETANDDQLIFEDAGHSGYHRPHWKFNVWLKSASKLPFMNQNYILYAVIFYDGIGNINVNLDKNDGLQIKAGYDTKKVIYPWAVATIGRGNPYHNIPQQKDDNGVVYFDKYGFVSYGKSQRIQDDNCGSFDNYQLPKEVSSPLISQ